MKMAIDLSDKELEARHVAFALTMMMKYETKKCIALIPKDVADKIMSARTFAPTVGRQA